MIRALVVKELRENWGFVVVALLLYGWALSTLTAWGPLNISFLFVWSDRAGIPFVTPSFIKLFIVVTGLFALTLGLTQAVRETRQGTYLFLLHRPWPRRAVFLTKLAVGGALIMTCAVIPILALAWWSATPGNVPAPFEWSMTGPAWRLWISMPLVYLGAFLSGLRPARWYGTRLLPLLSSVAGVLIFYLAPLTWELGVIYLVAIYLLFVGAICFLARTRDFT